MVSRASCRIQLPVFILVILGALSLAACTVDLLGLFGADDMEVRFADRNTFNFLTEEARSLSLGEEYVFLVFSDTHIEGNDAFGFEKLPAVIDDDVKFVVVTGDITQSGRGKEVQRFIEIARSVQVPCYPVLGNHDVYFTNWPVWRELIGSSIYRIDAPDSSATLFILDSANASFGKAQLDWFERELKTAKPRVFVFTHTNMFVKNLGDIQQFTDTRERAKMMNLLKGRCGAMFAGHVHNRIIKEFGGVRYITIEDYRHQKTYLRVRVSKTGIQYEFKKL